MTAAPTSYVDPRAGRLAAWITSGVLAVVLLTGSAPLLAAQTAIFALGAVFGLKRAPYATVFRWVRSTGRVGPPAELEAEGPLRFAQVVGLIFASVGVIGFAAGSVGVGTTATALALAAAFLNAAFGICLGCELYLIARRVTGRGAITRFVPARTIIEGNSA